MLFKRKKYNSIDDLKPGDKFLGVWGDEVKKVEVVARKYDVYLLRTYKILGEHKPHDKVFEWFKELNG